MQTKRVNCRNTIYVYSLLCKMPLYNKALKFKPDNLKDMTFDECYELLLCFRYLDFREDSSLSHEFMRSSMIQILQRMAELNPDGESYKSLI